MVTDVCTQTRSRYTQAQWLRSTPMYTQEQTLVHAAGHPELYTAKQTHAYTRNRIGHADVCTC